MAYSNLVPVYFHYKHSIKYMNLHIFVGNCHEKFEYIDTYCLNANIDIVRPPIGGVIEFREITLSECQELCQRQHNYCGLVFFMPHNKGCFLQPSYNHGSSKDKGDIQCDPENVTHIYHRHPCEGKNSNKYII